MSSYVRLRLMADSLDDVEEAADSLSEAVACLARDELDVEPWRIRRGRRGGYFAYGRLRLDSDAAAQR